MTSHVHDYGRSARLLGATLRGVPHVLDLANGAKEYGTSSEERVGAGTLRQPPSTLVDQGVWVSAHALERVRVHHPHTDVWGVLALLARAEAVTAGFVAPLLGRRLEDVRDGYLVSPDRRGCFVVAASTVRARFPWTLITYLRFFEYQTQVATRLLGLPDFDNAEHHPALHANGINANSRSNA